MNKNQYRFILFLFLILMPAFISCGIARKNIDPGMKFFFYETEHYIALLHLPKKNIKKIIPKPFDIKDNVLCKIQVSRYKKVYLPVDGVPFNALTVSLLVKYKDIHAWYPLVSLVSIPPMNILPLYRYGYENKLGIMNYQPGGTAFRASVKRDFTLFFEMEFTFLPRETAEIQPDKHLALHAPDIYIKDKKIVLVEDTYKDKKPEISIKDGFGAYVFHSSDHWNAKLFNSMRVEYMFFAEIKGNTYKRAFYLE